MAFTRSGNDLRIFLDGQIVGSATESGSFFDNSDDDVGVGSASGGSSSDPITGFISNVRVMKEVQFIQRIHHQMHFSQI